MNKQEVFIRKLFLNEIIKIEATDGKTSIAQSEKVFKNCWLDQNFINSGLDKPQNSSKETMIEIYEVSEGGTFEEMFIKFYKTLDKLNELCLTQNQIIEFCKNYKKLFQNHQTLFFLFKEKKWWQFKSKYYIACVDLLTGGLSIDMYKLKENFPWMPGFSYYIVIPEIK